MLNLQMADLAANASVNAVTALLNGGKLSLFDGKQPASGNETPKGMKALATLAFANPAFKSAVAGESEANQIGSDENAARTGTASWYRAFSADGESVFDGTVGVSGSNLNLSTVQIQQGARVSIHKLVYSQKS